ncbi:MAG: NAD(P)-dependent oxidoreductase, partial [Mucinivorans sp.]
TECRVVRLSNSYGAPIFVENNCWWLVVNDLCRMAHKDGQIILQSDGTPVRDFIHGNDVCRAVEAIIRTDNPRMTYNVSSGITLSILELANLVCKVYENRYNRPIKITTTPPNGNAATSERYTIDNSALLQLGYAPEWNLERGINDLFDFLEQNYDKI